MAGKKKGKIRRKKKINVSKVTKFSHSNAHRAYTCIIECTQAITGGGASLNYNFSLNYPSMHVNSGGNWVQMGGVTSHLTRLVNVFDMFKTLKMRVCFFPNTVNTVILTGDNPYEVYFEEDMDDITPINSDIKAMAEGHLPTGFANGKVIKRIVYQKKGFPWINTTQITNAIGGTVNPLTPTTPTVVQQVTPTMFQSMKLWFPNVPAGVILGRFVVQWLVRFKGFNTTN